MKACWYEKSGAARDVLTVGDMAAPVAGPGEVLVKLHVCGVNPTDVKRRSGARGALPFPRIVPGFDGAGIIAAVGDGVSAQRIGERVWIWEAQHRKPFGSAAELVVVPASRAMPLPDSVSFQDGASVGVPALTAHRALSVGGDLGGETVIVTGGAGAVGNYAIQLAKRMGASVIATARGPDKAKDARRAGADHVVDPRSEPLKKRVLDVTDGIGARHMVDVDLGAHLGAAWEYLAANGSIASYGTQSDPRPCLPFAQYMYKNISIHGVAIFAVPEAMKLAAASFVQDALTTGTLVHRLDSIFPLQEVAAAHERQESGAVRGKVLVSIG